jgi:Cu/Zn superoxide dismutase
MNKRLVWGEENLRKLRFVDQEARWNPEYRSRWRCSFWNTQMNATQSCFEKESSPPNEVPRRVLKKKVSQVTTNRVILGSQQFGTERQRDKEREKAGWHGFHITERDIPNRFKNNEKVESGSFQSMWNGHGLKRFDCVRKARFKRFDPISRHPTPIVIHTSKFALPPAKKKSERDQANCRSKVNLIWNTQMNATKECFALCLEILTFNSYHSDERDQTKCDDKSSHTPSITSQKRQEALKKPNWDGNFFRCGSHNRHQICRSPFALSESSISFPFSSLKSKFPTPSPRCSLEWFSFRICAFFFFVRLSDWQTPGNKSHHRYLRVPQKKRQLWYDKYPQASRVYFRYWW